MAKVRETGTVIRQEMLTPGMFSMWIRTSAGKDSVPGQFAALYSKDSARLLPRPFGICDVAEDGESLRIVYRVAGAGTEEFSRYQPGDSVEIMGPLGTGFPLAGKKALVIAGGSGVPPILNLAKHYPGTCTAVLGYRDRNTFLADDFKEYCDVYLATEDGSLGTKGNVLDAIRENGLKADVIYACGPAPMLRALKAYAKEQGIPCYISLEEKMACGIGACLACVCKTKEIDGHSNVHNTRICADGPVFDAEEVEL